MTGPQWRDVLMERLKAHPHYPASLQRALNILCDGELLSVRMGDRIAQLPRFDPDAAATLFIRTNPEKLQPWLAIVGDEKWFEQLLDEIHRPAEHNPLSIQTAAPAA